MSKTTINSIRARRVWDSRGHPTVEVEVSTAGGATGRAIAPAGASTGAGEAVDLRDGGAAFAGLDVQCAISGVRERIAPALIGMDAEDQAAIDGRMIEIDGTPNMASLGGNASIATSMATLHCAAAAHDLPLWRYLAGDRDPPHLPLPEVQIFGGGAHAERRVDIQDFMVVPVGADDYHQALEWVADVYRAAGALMSESGRRVGVADEGGFWPVFDTNEEAIEILVRAIEQSGRKPGQEIAISLDIAASEFNEDGRYSLSCDGIKLGTDAFSELILKWLRLYPIVAVEDPLAEDDLVGLAAFTSRAGSTVQVVADDAAVTSETRIRAAAAAGACNAFLMKPNQVGTVTGARAALEAAREVGWGAIISARSGETEDVTIVHMAVGWGIEQLKVGSFARSERMAKWNEGLRIADVAPCGAALPPADRFLWSAA
ncbi:MAG: phosphopyruvate hydratase [Roseitalea sp.]|jgi:enolase|nr:phosphopyruvate hydratase [Roseitalea sp.]MBO6721811.1 phosphopyruvate hydratase [Roseitalea sp.]MBO6744875.1 phosphopyruvate hydratase [Roseitalea sp.]